MMSTIDLHLSRKHTHGGEVRLVDLGDTVVASVEVSGVFGERRHTIQLQVITVDRATKTHTQQAGGHTWRMWMKRNQSRGRERRLDESLKRADLIKLGFRISGFMRCLRGNKDFLACVSEWCACVTSVLTCVNHSNTRLLRFTRLWQFRAHWAFYSANTLLRGFCCGRKQPLLLLETRLGVKETG